MHIYMQENEFKHTHKDLLKTDDKSKYKALYTLEFLEDSTEENLESGLL